MKAASREIQGDVLGSGPNQVEEGRSPRRSVAVRRIYFAAPVLVIGLLGLAALLRTQTGYRISPDFHSGIGMAGAFWGLAVGFTLVARLYALGAKRRNAEESLRESACDLEAAGLEAGLARAMHLGHVLDCSLTEIFVFDATTYRFIHVNRGARENVGYSMEELRNLTPVDLKPEFTLEAFTKLLEPLKTGEQETVRLFTVHRRKDGSEYPVEVHLQLTTYESCSAFVAVILDVTERERAQETVRKLSLAVEQSPVTVVITDPDGAIEYVNPKFTETSGYTLDEALGRNPRLLKSGHTSPAEYKQLWETVAAGKVWRGEFHNKKKNGEFYWEAATISPMVDSEGNVSHILAVKEDITERKQVDTALRMSEERYRTLFNSSRDAIMTLTAEDGFLSCNPATMRLFGCRDDKDFTSNAPADLSPEYQPDGAPSSVKSQQMMALALEYGAHFFEWKHRRVDGSVFDATVLLTRMELEGRWMLQATVRDVSDQKRKEAELERLNREVVDASRRAGKADVATGVLHNVGNVLNSVNVSANLVVEKLRESRIDSVSRIAEMLDEHAGDMAEFLRCDQRGRRLPAYVGRLGEYLAREREGLLQELAGLQENIEHIKEIVQVQQDEGGVLGVIEEIRLNEVLEGALSINDAGFQRHKIEVVREYEEVPPVSVDRHRLMQILVNLVGNAKHALQSTPSGRRRLTLRLRLVGDRVRLEVSDNGTGIPPEVMPRIFEHGFTTKEGGHGFGLHSSALAAGELGGSLTARSDGPGHGATFCLQIPATVREETLCPT